MFWRQPAVAGKPKQRLENISLAQWVSANARILSKLISDGVLDSFQTLQYLEYTAKVGDFAQTCEIGSVIVYDNEYRKWIHEKYSREWGEDNAHLTL